MYLRITWFIGNLLGMPEAPARKMVATLCPGPDFNYLWVNNWSDFIPKLLQEHNALTWFGVSNNIYYIRNRAVSDLQAQVPLDQVDYILWIDSDNLVTYEQFKLLRDTLDAHPEASGVGAWYYVQSGVAAGAEIAAGVFKDGVDTHITDAQIKEALDKSMPMNYQGLIEVDYMGFGFLLMRPRVLKDLGPDPFNPIFSSTGSLRPDDTSFLLKAKEKGHRFFLHPRVFVPHLKLLGIVPQQGV